MKKSMIVSFVSACSLLVATNTLAAPPDKAQKSPGVHFNGVLNLNTGDPDRTATYIAGPFSTDTTLEISGITTTNFGSESVAIQYRAVWPDPSTPPSESGSTQYCSEGYGEGRIFHVIDEMARVAVPGGNTFNIAIPGETQVPGQYSSAYGGVVEPSEEWCVVAFYMNDSLHPLPIDRSIVDVKVRGKIETP